MNNELIAFLATLGALIIVFIGALVASALGVTITEAYGLGTVTGGLIGVLSRPRTPTP